MGNTILFYCITAVGCYVASESESLDQLMVYLLIARVAGCTAASQGVSTVKASQWE